MYLSLFDSARREVTTVRFIIMLLNFIFIFLKIKFFQEDLIQSLLYFLKGQI